MINSEDSFIITINLSEILSDKCGVFTMLIDYTKMTIVYEVIERIRWMFSLSGCLFLCHKNSIIHEIEDIKILALLKEFIVKPCNGISCHHEVLYKNLLSKIDFYELWNQMRVPKFFAEKLSLINQKLCSENEFRKKHCEVNDTTLNSPSIVPLEQKILKSVELMDSQTIHNFNASAVVNKTHTTSKKQPDNNFINNNNFSPNHEPVTSILESPFATMNEFKTHCVTKEENKIEKLSSPPSKNLSVERNKVCLSGESLSKAIPSQNVQKIIESKPVSNKNITKASNSIKIVHSKRKNYIKPFSLAEVVASLRNETENTTKDSKINTSPSMSQKDENKDKVEFHYATKVNTAEVVNKKKRKRTRKHKNKNKHFSLDDNEFLNESTAFSSYEFKLNENKKSSHIRFSSNSDSDDNIQTQCKNLDSIDQINVTSPNNSNHSCELLETQDEKKPTSSMNSIKNTNYALDCAPVYYYEEVQREGDLIFLDGEMADEMQNNMTNEQPEIRDISEHSLKNELNFLRNKVPFPVVFERFG